MGLTNHELAIRLRKPGTDNKEQDARAEISTFEDKVAIVHSVGKDIAKSIFAGIIIYVTVDTARKVIIARSTPK